MTAKARVLLHHVQVSCPEGGEDAARRFYGEVLGLPEVAKPPALAKRGGCWFRDEGVEVHVGVEADFRPALAHHGPEVSCCWIVSSTPAGTFHW